jgi:hypothetical protein
MPNLARVVFQFWEWGLYFPREGAAPIFVRFYRCRWAKRG